MVESCKLRAPISIRTFAGYLAVGMLAIGVLAGCGGQSGPPAGSISVTMTEYKFAPSQISAKAGKVEFWLINSGTTAHDIVITDSSGNVVGRSDLVTAGDTFDLKVNNIAAGTYQFYCDVPGHKESGMVGTLTVT